VVVDTGPGAEFPEYLTYAVSEQGQIYIDVSANLFIHCTVFTAEFNWT